MNTHLRETKGLWAYFVLTYAMMLLTWGLMAAFQLPGAASASHTSAPAPDALVLFFLGGFTPSIAGIVMTWYRAGRRGLHDLCKRAIRFKFGWQWYVAILVVPILIFLVRLVVQFARGGAFVESHLLSQPLNLIGFTISIILLDLFGNTRFRKIAAHQKAKKYEPIVISDKVYWVRFPRSSAGAPSPWSGC
jgi:hypothetical protein